MSGSAPTTLKLYDMLPEITGCEVIFNQLTMSPSPSREHQFLLIRLTTLLFQFLNEKQNGILLTAPFDVYFEEEQSIVQPDLFVMLNSDQHLIKRMVFTEFRLSLSKLFQPTAPTIPNANVPFMKKPA
jgi:hypothetical protein